MQAKEKIDQANNGVDWLWTLTTALFVVGGMIGAFSSKYVLDFMGRKKGILFHYLFTLIGSILVVVAPYFNSPECVIISRFLFGVQGGLISSLKNIYNIRNTQSY
jgi:MFS family permease